MRSSEDYFSGKYDVLHPNSLNLQKDLSECMDFFCFCFLLKGRKEVADGDAGWVVLWYIKQPVLLFFADSPNGGKHFCSRRRKLHFFLTFSLNIRVFSRCRGKKKPLGCLVLTPVIFLSGYKHCIEAKTFDKTQCINLVSILLCLLHSTAASCCLDKIKALTEGLSYSMSWNKTESEISGRRGEERYRN